MRVNEKLKQISKLLWDFESLREEHILKICNCSESDINYLISKKVIIKDKDTKILRYNNKAVNSRNIVAFDIVMEYLDRNVKVKKSKHPVNVTMQTNECTYDIIAIKEKEIDALYENIDKISKSDKVIIIIEAKNYIGKNINTQRPCCICTYPPLEIVDIIS